MTLAHPLAVPVAPAEDPYARERFVTQTKDAEAPVATF